MELVCFQGTDKQNWPQVNALIKKGDWEKIFLLKDSSTESFSTPENCIKININSKAPLLELKENIIESLKPALSKDFEVALSIASSTGKESMALISALLNIPVGIRLVAFTKKGIEFIS